MRILLYALPIVMPLGLAVQFRAPQAKPDVHVVSGVLAQRALERPVAAISVAAGRAAMPSVLRAFGLADVERKLPASSNTVFKLDALTVYLASAAVMRLVDAGRVALDEDVTRYVPDAPTQKHPVSIRQLLSQTAGLPDARDALFEFLPGASWRESPDGTALIATLIERVTGQPLADHLRDQIFRPLGMTATSTCGTDVVSDRASPYKVDAGALAPALAAAARSLSPVSICTTAGDLYAFERALNGARLVSRNSLAAMRRNTTLTDGTDIPYGLGMRIGAINGRRVTGFASTEPGYDGASLTFGDEGLSVVVLTNTGNGAAAPLATAIARSALEVAPPTAADTVVPPAEAASIVGSYRSSRGPMIVSVCRDKICVSLPGATGTRTARRETPFAYALDADTQVRFAMSPVATWAFIFSGGIFVDAPRMRTARPAQADATVPRTPPRPQ